MKKIISTCIALMVSAACSISAFAMEVPTNTTIQDLNGVRQYIITQRLRTSIPLLGRPVPARTQMPYCSRLSRTAASAKWTPRPLRMSSG